jgi:hypothetical protein
MPVDSKARLLVHLGDKVSEPSQTPLLSGLALQQPIRQIGYSFIAAYPTPLAL